MSGSVRGLRERQVSPSGSTLTFEFQKGFPEWAAGGSLAYARQHFHRLLAACGRPQHGRTPYRSVITRRDPPKSRVPTQ